MTGARAAWPWPARDWPWVPNDLARAASWSVLWLAWPLALLLPRSEIRKGAAAPAILPQSGPAFAPWTCGSPTSDPVEGTVWRDPSVWVPGWVAGLGQFHDPRGRKMDAGSCQFPWK